MTISRSTFIGVPLLLAFALTGCGSTPKTQLYALQAPAPASTLPTSETSRAESRPQVSVGRVTLPERVDRPQIVVLTGEHTVHASDFNRWAEPLKAAVPRQLVSDLARELGSTQVRLYGQGGSDADVRIEVDVLRFDATLADAAVVEAVWTLRRKGQAPRSGRSLIRERLTADGYPALVAGLARATAGVSRDLAVAIRELR